MSIDLVLKPSCGGCGTAEELYGSTCKHLTLCVSCGKSMAEKRSKCDECGTPITRLIREYNVHANSSNDKSYFIGRFYSGLPTFEKKNENKWSMQKEGLLGRQVTDALRERFKNRPWLLEDETGQFQYHGRLEGKQAATYYILMLRRKELVAIPAGSWYNFNKVPKYKQLTLEEAEEKMNSRSKTADCFQKWTMKAALNGAAAFGGVEKFDDREGRRKTTGDDEANDSDRGEEEEDEEEEEETARKGRLGLNKRSGDDDEEGARGGDLDFDDDDIEKGDHWEYEEIFTDDDEAVYPNELEDPESPEHPEIKQDDEDEDEDEADEEDGGSGLSKSGKELKKLLRRANRMKDSKAEDDNDITKGDISCMRTPKNEALKEEAVDNSIPLKETTCTAGRGTPSTSKSSKRKSKSSREESKPPNGGAPLKKVKIENCKTTCIIKKYASTSNRVGKINRVLK